MIKTIDVMLSVWRIANIKPSSMKTVKNVLFYNDDCHIFVECNKRKKPIKIKTVLKINSTFRYR